MSSVRVAGPPILGCCRCRRRAGVAGSPSSRCPRPPSGFRRTPARMALYSSFRVCGLGVAAAGPVAVLSRCLAVVARLAPWSVCACRCSAWPASSPVVHAEHRVGAWWALGPRLGSADAAARCPCSRADGSNFLTAQHGAFMMERSPPAFIVRNRERIFVDTERRAPPGPTVSPSRECGGQGTQTDRSRNARVVAQMRCRSPSAAGRGS